MLLDCVYLSQHQENSCINTHNVEVIIEGERGEGVPVYLINSEGDSEVSVRGWTSCLEPNTQHMANAAPRAGLLSGSHSSEVPCGQWES